MFLEVQGFQYDISAQGEMGEFCLKTCKKETATGVMGKLAKLCGSVCSSSIISSGAGTLLGSRTDMAAVINKQLIYLVSVPD